MKYFFEVLGPNNIAAKNGLSISNSFCTGPCTKFAPFSISTCKFCKNLQKFACFVTFGCIRAYLIMRTLKNSKFDTYWLTRVYTVQWTKVVYATNYPCVQQIGMFLKYWYPVIEKLSHYSTNNDLQIS